MKLPKPTLEITKKPELLFGIELEIAYNPVALYGIHGRNLLNANIGEYHAGNPISEYWTIENDGSIHTSSKIKKDGSISRFNYTAELVSTPFKHSEFKTVMNDLISNVFKNKHLFNLLDINDSCGNHVHFSVITSQDKKKVVLRNYEDHIIKTLENTTFKNNTLTHKNILKLRRDLFKMLNDVQKNRYFRHYARKHTLNSFHDGDRYKEVNFIDNEHYELRSLNFTGVKTWTELISLYEKTFSLLEKHVLNKKGENWKLKSDDLKTEVSEPEIEKKVLKDGTIENFSHVLKSDDRIKDGEVVTIKASTESVLNAEPESFKQNFLRDTERRRGF